MKNAHIINFLKTFSFNPSCKKILDDFDNLNNNKEELDKFVKGKNNEAYTYKVVLYKDDLSCLIQQIKEEKTISENVYKLLVDGKLEHNSFCLMVYFRIVVENGTGQLYIKYEYSAFFSKKNEDDSLLILDTLVSFSEFASFIKTWLDQHDKLHEKLHKEMPNFLWFFKVFLTTQYENYFEPNFD